MASSLTSTPCHRRSVAPHPAVPCSPTALRLRHATGRNTYLTPEMSSNKQNAAGSGQVKVPMKPET